MRMDGRRRHIRGLVLGFIESLLKLYPPRFRHEFSSEIQPVLLSRLRDADVQGRWPSTVFREVAGIVASIIRERWHELRFREDRIMTITTERPRWFFYFGWVALNVSAVIMAWYLSWAIISQVTNIFGDTIRVGGESHITEDAIFLCVLFPITGLLIGILQFILLRRYLPHMTSWIAATFLGWLMPFIIGYFVLTLLARRNDTFSIMLGMLLIGASVAVPQWWVLRQRVRHASGWILGYGLGWAMVGLLSLVPALSDPFPVLIAFGLIPAICTSVVCWLLLDWFPKHEVAMQLS